MAKRTRTFWEYWNCTSCPTEKIRGDNKRCPSCGNPREVKELSDAYLGRGTDPTTGRVLAGDHITDATELSQTERGPDRHCEACGSGNYGDALNCSSCGSPMFEVPIGPPEQEREPEPVYTPPPPPRQYRPYTPPVDSEDVHYTGYNKTVWVAMAFLLMMSIVCGFIWGAQTHQIPGTVTNMAWRRTVHVETYTKYTESGWGHDLQQSSAVMPVRGSGERAGVENIRNCNAKHYDDEKIRCGTEQVCKDVQYQSGTKESCSVTSNGNGSATETCVDVPTYTTKQKCNNEPKYCDKPIYKDYCDYDTWKWSSTRIVPNAGVGTENIVWPTVALGPLDRQSQTERYEITFTYTDGETPKFYTLETASQRDYLSWGVGKKGVLKVRNIGTISEVLHEGQIR